MMTLHWWFAVAFGAVLLTATPALARGGFFFSFHSGLGGHHGFHRHFGGPFFGGVPHHHLFGPQFGFRHPKFFHDPFVHHFGFHRPRFFLRPFLHPAGRILDRPIHHPHVIILQSDPLIPWGWR